MATNGTGISNKEEEIGIDAASRLLRLTEHSLKTILAWMGLATKTVVRDGKSREVVQQTDLDALPPYMVEEMREGDLRRTANAVRNLLCRVGITLNLPVARQVTRCIGGELVEEGGSAVCAERIAARFLEHNGILHDEVIRC